MMRALKIPRYYASAIIRGLLPYQAFLPQLRENIQKLEHLSAQQRERLEYYNMMSQSLSFEPRGRISQLRMTQRSRYYIDFMKVAKAFGPSFRVDTLFGDVTHVPPVPTVVKSRPIAGDRANSVLLPLGVMRHFRFVADKVSFEEKLPYAVWRGRLNSSRRRMIASSFYERADHNIGHVSRKEKHNPPPKLWIGTSDQLRYRYVLSLEGRDVATNLKWIMSSNSIAVSPKLLFETWFMEGRLVPGVHFIEVQDDLADLDEKLKWYEAHPEAGSKIIHAANRWVSQFGDPRAEFMLAQLVLYKYAMMTGQEQLLRPCQSDAA